MTRGPVGRFGVRLQGLVSEEGAEHGHDVPAWADHVRGQWSRQTVLLIGRHLFDLTNGREGHPPARDHVMVVSHTRRRAACGSASTGRPATAPRGW